MTRSAPANRAMSGAFVAASAAKVQPSASKLMSTAKFELMYPNRDP